MNRRMLTLTTSSSFQASFQCVLLSERQRPNVQTPAERCLFVVLAPFYSTLFSQTSNLTPNHKNLLLRCLFLTPRVLLWLNLPIIPWGGRGGPARVDRQETRREKNDGVTNNLRRFLPTDDRKRPKQMSRGQMRHLSKPLKTFCVFHTFFCCRLIG